MDPEFTLQLKKPIKFGDLTFDRLLLAEPLVGELEQAGSMNSIGRNVKLLSLIATRCEGNPVPESAIKQMVQSDFAKALDFFVPAATPGREPGSE